MKRIFYLLIFLTAPMLILKAQKQPEHKAKMHRSEDGKLYVNKHQPMYLFIGTDPTNMSEAKKLESEQSSKYANPFYFDSEGLNTVRTPSQVDPVTRQLVQPIQDVVFEVYADGLKPKTTSKFHHAPRSVVSTKRYYGKGLKVMLSAKDKTSGIEKIFYSIDEQPFQEFKDSISFNEEKEYKLSYYSVDYVGNAEKVIVENFIVDKTAPSVDWKLDGEVSGIIASGRSYIEIIASDEVSGVKNIKYQIGDGTIRLYSSKIPLSAFTSEDHSLKFWVEDNVKNISDQSAGSDINVYSFTVDKIAPTISAEVIGDKYKGKYLYVSARSKCKLTAQDSQSDISKIWYSKNTRDIDEVYSEPFSFINEQGQQTAYFRSIDMVANKSSLGTLIVKLDNEEPMSGIDFKGPQQFNRDTMFINKNTDIILLTEDNLSGVQKTEYVVDNKPSVTGNKFRIEEDGLHKITFATTDNVNNREQDKVSEVVVDNAGPEIYVNFSIKPIGTVTENGKEIKIYPPFVKMYIGATDIHCGTNSIWYAIDGGTKKNYAISGSPADVQMFKKEKTYTVTIDSDDNLGNKNSKEVTFRIAKK